MALAGWQHTGNPVYIWRAIDIYAKNSTLLPPAVFDYLSATARRMDKARATKDLRSALPVIMGFRTKRGPGRPLDPDSTDPDRLDLGRGARNHVAFGYGIHQCLGQPLARVELQIALPALFTRFPGLRVTTPVDQLPFKDDAFVYGVRELPVAW